MPCYLYIMLFYSAYTHEHVLLHIHVLTCVNVPIMLDHMTTQNKDCFADTYIIDHSFIYVCTS